MDFRKLCINCMKEKPQTDGACPFCGFEESRYEKPKYTLDPRTVLKGKYMIGKLIDRGGFGIMYKAFDMNLEHTVAIKEYYIRDVMSRDTSKSDQITVAWANETQKKLYEINREKFEKEAKTLASLSDLPGIVQVLDYFNELGTSYIVMEYLPGDTLREYVKKNGGRLTAAQTREKILPVMISLEYVHERGILHRDISPDNMKILDTEITGGSVKLFDFGGARIESKTPDDPKSVMVLKKEGYTPSEQIAGSNNQGPWTDVYALSATIFFCLCGRAPADANERAADPSCFRSPAQLGVPVSDAVQEALIKGLALQSADRYQNVTQLREALEAAGWGDEDESDGIEEPGFSDLPSGSQVPSDVSSSTESSGSIQAAENSVSKRRQNRRGLPVFAAMIASLLIGIGCVAAGLFWPDEKKAVESKKQSATQIEVQDKDTEMVLQGHMRQNLGSTVSVPEEVTESTRSSEKKAFTVPIMLLDAAIVWFILSAVFLVFWWLVRKRKPDEETGNVYRGLIGTQHKDKQRDSGVNYISNQGGQGRSRKNGKGYNRNHQPQDYQKGLNQKKSNSVDSRSMAGTIRSGGVSARNDLGFNQNARRQKEDKKRVQDREARRRREENARQRKLEAAKKKKAVSPQLLHLTRHNDLVQAVLPLTLPKIIIGTSQNSVTYLITGNNRVSRRHAMVTFEQGRYYLTDLGSTNGTFLNGTRIITNKKYPVNPGDRIALFNERFIFIVVSGNARIIPGMAYRWRR